MIVFLGTSEFAVPILKKLIENNYDVSLVITQPDKKSGRKQQLVFSPVKSFALKHNLKLFQPEKIKDNFQPLLDEKPKILITASYGQILPRELLAAVRSYNLHGSLLPKYRGGAPIQYALFNNDKQTGVTLMEMVFKMDAGDMIDKQSICISADDDYGSLTKKLADLAADLLLKNIKNLLNNTYTKEKQDINEVSFAYTIKPDDELIKWDWPVDIVLGRIKGLSPNVGATCSINGKKVKIFQAKSANFDEKSKPGKIILLKKQLLVGCLDGWISVQNIQVEGKKQLDVVAFLNGQTLFEDNSYFDINQCD